jgi:hypothetical protein
MGPTNAFLMQKKRAVRDADAPKQARSKTKAHK